MHWVKNRYWCKNSSLRCSIMTLADAFKAVWHSSHMPASITQLETCCHLETKSQILTGSPESHLTLYPILLCLVIKDGGVMLCKSDPDITEITVTPLYYQSFQWKQLKYRTSSWCCCEHMASQVVCIYRFCLSLTSGWHCINSIWKSL